MAEFDLMHGDELEGTRLRAFCVDAAVRLGGRLEAKDVIVQARLFEEYIREGDSE